MKQLIIIPNDEGGVAVIYPTGEMPVEIVARKDVPAGVPYRIVSEDAVPGDRTFREAWESDFTEPDGFGDPEGYWAELVAGGAA